MERDSEWWAVAKDVADTLGYEKARNAIEEHCKTPIIQRINVDDVMPQNILQRSLRQERRKTCSSSAKKMSIA
jgi:prophage antirepressor-like protein